MLQQKQNEDYTLYAYEDGTASKFRNVDTKRSDDIILVKADDVRNHCGNANTIRYSVCCC